MRKIITLMIAIIAIGILPVSVNAEIFSYGEQLNTYEKTIYDTMYNHYCIQKNTNKLSLELNLTSTKKSCGELHEEYVYAANMAYSALIKDYPQIYWAKKIKVSYVGTDYFENGDFSYSEFNNAKIAISGGTPYDANSIKKFNKAFKKAVKKINKYAGKNPGRTKIIKSINKWICKNTKYDYYNGNNQAKKYEYLHSSYGVFVKKKAVCDGYCTAFKMLCDYYKIPCMINLGYACGDGGTWEEHAWNLVRVKKRWYIVDSTWNDTNKSSKWMLCGSKNVKKTHFNSRKRLDICGEGYFALPQISKNKYKR